MIPSWLDPSRSSIPLRISENGLRTPLEMLDPSNLLALNYAQPFPLLQRGGLVRTAREPLTFVRFVFASSMRADSEQPLSLATHDSL